MLKEINYWYCDACGGRSHRTFEKLLGRSLTIAQILMMRGEKMAMGYAPSETIARIHSTRKFEALLLYAITIFQGKGRIFAMISKLINNMNVKHS
ncbi:hypothetical protein WKK05_29375 [Nostoc sp. UHCC 0302]|uniref:hypothetical protein n=1 Tax=Nostoc sp. UHCC 0302 TaxID=3134896 RepID=UPI00311CDE7D